MTVVKYLGLGSSISVLLAVPLPDCLAASSASLPSAKHSETENTARYFSNHRNHVSNTHVEDAAHTAIGVAALQGSVQAHAGMY